MVEISLKLPFKLPFEECNSTAVHGFHKYLLKEKLPFLRHNLPLA